MQMDAKLGQLGPVRMRTGPDVYLHSVTFLALLLLLIFCIESLFLLSAAYITYESHYGTTLYARTCNYSLSVTTRVGVAIASLVLTVAARDVNHTIYV